MKLERFEARGRGPMALIPEAVGAFFPVVESPPKNDAVASGSIAVVYARGPLVHHDEWWCDSYDAIKSRVAAALTVSPKAVVLAIDSPGGLVSGCFDTAAEIRAMCDAAGVELHSYVDGLAASAGYALAAVGQSITIPSSGIAGSIGCIEMLLDATAANAQMGLAVELVASGARKTDGNPNAPVTDAARAAVQARVEELAVVFAEHVAKYRPRMTVESIRAQEAGLYTGASAVRAGLADRVASLDELVAMLAAGSAAQGAQEDRMTDEEKARAALQAIVDDEESDDKAKARAKAALAAMDEPDGDEGDGDGETKGETKDEGGSSARSAIAPLAATSASLEARLAALEAEREAERKAALFAARPDVGAETQKALAGLPFAQVKGILESIPKRKPAPAASAQVPSTRGEDQQSDPVSGLPAKPVSNADAMALAMGRASVDSRGVARVDANTIVLGADVVALPKKGA